MGRTTARTRRVVAVAACSLLLLAPSVASADGIDDGLWYYNATGLEEIHQRVTGAGVQIALVDGLVNPSAPDLVGTSLALREPSYCGEVEGGPAAATASTTERARHTTSMASLLIGTGTGTGGEAGVKGVSPGAAVTVYAARLEDYLCPTSPDEPIGPRASVPEAIAAGSDIIVVPGGVDVRPADILAAARAGVIVVASAGNDGGAIADTPATLNGVVTTGSTTVDGSLDARSPSGERLGVVAPGKDLRSTDPTYSYYGVTSGSSNSAAYTAGVLALAMEAFPDATSNQILQALARTTDGSLHELDKSLTRGFGQVDARALLASDPSSFPDENPFVGDLPSLRPPATEFAPASTPTASEEPDDARPTDEPHSAPTDDAESNSVVVVLGVAGAVLVVVLVLTVVVVRRRRTTSSTDTGPHGGHHHG
ncbi:S8 family serine peptidase [Cellulomonas sp. NPDC058312]|jgi:hypothetical protein|uniref:S8 family peptidase n=1 Tax=Cellulomonas sp. NPDC058312 TaxID=3346441 RepID=UPI0036F1243D